MQKFHYPKSFLNSEAAQVLYGIEIRAENYENAWELLKNRHTRIIIQKHIRSIFELPVSSKEISKLLRDIYDGSNKHITALKTLKEPA